MSLKSKISRRGFLNYMLLGSATIVLPTLSFRPIAQAGTKTGMNRKFLVILVNGGNHIFHATSPIAGPVAAELGRRAFVDKQGLDGFVTGSKIKLGNIYEGLPKSRLDNASVIRGVHNHSPVEQTLSSTSAHRRNHRILSVDLGADIVSTVASADNQVVVSDSGMIQSVNLGAITTEDVIATSKGRSSDLMASGSLLGRRGLNVDLGSDLSDEGVVVAAVNSGVSGTVIIDADEIDNAAHGSTHNMFRAEQDTVEQKVNTIVSQVSDDCDIFIASTSCRQPAIGSDGLGDSFVVGDVLTLAGSNNNNMIPVGTDAGETILVDGTGKAYQAGSNKQLVSLGEGREGRRIERRLAGNIDLGLDTPQIASTNSRKVTLAGVIDLGAGDGTSEEAEAVREIVELANKD